jgi:hypothetical protein
VATSKWPFVIGRISKKASTSLLASITKLLGDVLSGLASASVGIYVSREALGEDEVKVEGDGQGKAEAMLQNGQRSGG